MRKLLAVVIILCVAINFYGCRHTMKPAVTAQPSTSEQTFIAEQNSEPEETVEPPAEMKLEEKLLLFREIYLAFSRKDDPNEIFNISTPNGDLTNHAALEYCYQQLIALESIDPYLTEEKWSEYLPNRALPPVSRKELLSRFSVVENVLLRVECVETKLDGNTIDYDEYVVWHYNPDGTLNHLHRGVERLPEYRYLRFAFMTDIKFDYNDDGIVDKIWIGQIHDLNGSMDIFYDEQGRLSGAQKDNTHFFCSYDDKGNLSQVIKKRLVSSDKEVQLYAIDRWDLYYAFDSYGNIVKQTEHVYYDDVLQAVNTATYTYNDANQICEMEIFWERYRYYDDIRILNSTMRNRYTFTYDEQGRLLTRTTYPGNRIDEGGIEVYQDIKTKVDTYIYGNQYIFGEYVIDYPDD